MRFAVAAVVAALVAGISANYTNATTIFTTEVVTAYTTYCPTPTSIVHGNQTYTVTEATTLTITNCPCTLTKPLVTSIIVSSTTSPTSSVVPTTSAKPTYSNSTTAVTTSAAAGTAATSTTPATTSTTGPQIGGAGRAFLTSGGLFAGLVGMVAWML